MQADCVFSRRIIFLGSHILPHLEEDAIEGLRGLSSSFLLAAAVETAETRAMGVTIVEEAGFEAFLRERCIETYASWFVGTENEDGGRARRLGFKVLRSAAAGDGKPDKDEREARRFQSISEAVNHIRRTESESRIVIHYERLAPLVESLRRKGKGIVFTNGVFDLMHIGHFRLLEEAGRLGGALIVGINSDDSTRAIKGSGRPIVPQFARAEILAGLRPVERCVIFVEPDPKRLIAELKPDVLVKSSEYSMKEVVGRELVEKYGGKVVLLPFISGISTTSTIRRIWERGA